MADLDDAYDISRRGRFQHRSIPFPPPPACGRVTELA